MILQADEEDSETDVVLQPPEPPDTEDSSNELPVEDLHLSLDAFKGVRRAQTIRFATDLHGMTIHVMIDGGSNDNFLQPRLAKFLKLEVEQSPKLRVMVGNGNKLETEGYIRNIYVNMQGAQIDLPVFLLPVSGADLIIGTNWLSTVGPHIHDYRDLNIKFHYKGQQVTLQGDKYNQINLEDAQYHHIKRLYSMDAIHECYAIRVATVVDNNKLQLPEQMEPALATLLHTYRQVFDVPIGLPPPRMHDHSIPLLEGSNPVKVKPYRYPHSQKAQIELMIQEMLNEGLIQPSTSPFSSPIILVKKKDGTWRFCTDYRALNVLTIKDSFPIPTVDDLIDELHGATHFSKLDLRSGYHQILVKPEDRYKTAFQTHQGHYEWLVMPFGLTNAPATFQSLMNHIFQGWLRKFVLVFFDDILVYSPDWSSHLQHLETVLQVLQKEHLFAKLSKCSFGATNINYLGHTISNAGFAKEEDKIRVVKDWPKPTSLKLLRGFLGLTGYYRRFIRNYASLATPLTDMLKKDNFKWTTAAEDAFMKLKEALTSSPVLALPNFTQPFTLETDASGIGIGAVLLQQAHPVAYCSKKLSTRQQKQSAYARELYAITQAIAKFRHYLLGHKFTIKIDQKSLKELLDQSLHTPEQQQWFPKFLGYDFTIQYKPGKENVVVDALSRCMSMAIFEPVNQWLQDIQARIKEDPELQIIMAKLDSEPKTVKHFAVHNGILFWKKRTVLPNDEELKKKIMTKFHNSLVGGHAGRAKTIARVCSQFYWVNMHQDIRMFVHNCKICQQTKTETAFPIGLLQPLPIPIQVWDDIAMDFIIDLPPSQGFTAIMVIVDRLSKFGHFIPMRYDFNSKQVADAFINNVVKLHGISKSIVSDRDKVFISSFWKQL